MVKKIIKYFWILMLFMLICLPIHLQAADNSNHPEDGVYKAVHVDPDDLSGYDLHASAVEGDSSDASTDADLRIFSEEIGTGDTGLYRSQMTDLSAEIYDGIADTSINASNNGVSLTHYFESGETYSTVWDAYKAAYASAMWGYARDHQDQFLWTTNEIGLNGSYSSTKITLVFSYTVSTYYTSDLGEEVNAQINSVVSACGAQTRETKLKYYHDWLTSTNSYDTDIAELTKDDGSAEFYYGHSAVGCLIKGKGVCESYAKAFKIFCLKANIPCLIVSSSSHAWNYVKMEDGNWYMIDCTWDDPIGGTGYYYNYYLISNYPNVDSAHTVDSYFTYPDTATTKYTHNYALKTKVASTCTTAGYVEYKCSDCDETYKEALPLDPNNHEGTTQLSGAKDATCGKDGYSGDKVCSSCGVTIETGSVIPATGNHTYGDGVVTKEATCSSTGVMTYTCSVCGSEKTESIDKDSSNHEGTTQLSGAKDATCGEDGYSGDKVCSSCGATIETGSVIPATGKHTYDDGVVTKEATCSSTGVMTYTCSVCGSKLTESIDKDSSNHEGTTHLSGAKEATCGKDGYSGDQICDSCNGIAEKGSVIPATGKHSYGDGVVTKEATCSSTGVMTYTCSVCGFEKTESIDKDSSNHEGTTLSGKTDPTCSKEGYTGDTVCSACGSIFEKGSVIEKTEHSKVIDKGYSATCGKDGKTDGSHCSVCGVVIDAQENIPATGNHSYGDGVVTKEATCSSTGVMTYTCSVCGSKKTESIAKDSSNHEATKISGRKYASCIEEGYTGDTVCSGCGIILEKGSVIEKTEHSKVIDKGYNATCGKDGKTDGSHCSICGVVIDVQKNIPATGNHSYGSWTTTKSATVFQTGIRTRKCKVCGATQKQTTAKLTPVIKLSKTSLTLKVKKKYQLKVTMAKGDSVKSWKSSNKKIATITSKGKITAKKKGKVTITVILKSGKKATCKLKVK